MTLLADIAALLRTPRMFLRGRLAAEASLQALMLGTVLPLVSIRPASVLVRSVLTGHVTAGAVLALSSVALQLGCWLGLAAALPWLAKQFAGEVSEPHARVLATYASAPLWIAGVLYLVPEDPWVVFFGSRLLVSIAALHGLLLLWAGLEQLGVGARRFIVAVATAGYAALYFVLFVALGLAAHVVLFFAGG